eukprot:GGOE01023775.1.p1 GENE.GGOE01023775.1~~GGOE01023775.1.p1  ORF type:complete len:767 (+),score=113.83 GGOE01023775.1:129-2429(+)
MDIDEEGWEEDIEVGKVNRHGVLMVEVDPDDWVDCHNAKRQLHGVPYVEWSEEVALSAARWARFGQCTHSPEDCEYGESLFRSTTKPSAQRVVNAWYSEIEHFDFDNPAPCPSAGHFTQLVWKDCQEIGCAMCQMEGGDWLVICQYSPAGNWRNRFASQVPPPLQAESDAGLSSTEVEGLAERGRRHSVLSERKPSVSIEVPELSQHVQDAFERRAAQLEKKDGRLQLPEEDAVASPLGKGTPWTRGRQQQKVQRVNASPSPRPSRPPPRVAPAPSSPPKLPASALSRSPRDAASPQTGQGLRQGSPVSEASGMSSPRTRFASVLIAIEAPSPAPRSRAMPQSRPLAEHWQQAESLGDTEDTTQGMEDEEDEEEEEEKEEPQGRQRQRPMQPRRSPPKRQPSHDQPRPSSAQRRPSPGQRRPSPEQRRPSPGHRRPSPAQCQPSPAPRRPSPGQRRPSPAQRPPVPPAAPDLRVPVLPRSSTHPRPQPAIPRPSRASAWQDQPGSAFPPARQKERRQSSERVPMPPTQEPPEPAAPERSSLAAPHSQPSPEKPPIPKRRPPSPSTSRRPAPSASGQDPSRAVRKPRPSTSTSHVPDGKLWGGVASHDPLRWGRSSVGDEDVVPTWLRMAPSARGVAADPSAARRDSTSSSELHDLHETPSAHDLYFLQQMDPRQPERSSWSLEEGLRQLDHLVPPRRPQMRGNQPTVYELLGWAGNDGDVLERTLTSTAVLRASMHPATYLRLERTLEEEVHRRIAVRQVPSRGMY